MKFETVPTATPPRRATPEQAEYDRAIRTMRETGKPIAITVAPEGDPKSIRTRLTRAATRAGVKVEAWYDKEQAQVYARLKGGKAGG